jgi:hypothetical protein
MTTSTPINDNVAVQEESGLAPRPEEKTWKYYSRHHEMPASGVSSLAVHLAAISVLIVGGLLTAKVASNSRPPEIVPALAPDTGDKDAGNGRSSGIAKNEERVEDVKQAEKASSVPMPAIGTLVGVKRRELIPDQTNGEHAIEARFQKAMKDLDQQAEEALRQTDGPRGGSGPRADGRHSTGDKVGKTGPPDGSEDGTLTIERRRRWQLNFQVTGPIDHLRQFAGLDAILAVPEPEGGYRVFKNLGAWPGLKAPDGRHPPSEHIDMLAHIHRIGFADREPKTVAEVTDVLGTPLAPYILAFFPKDLEGKMVCLEEELHNRREEDIHSKTYFQVVPRGSGYDVVIERGRAASP